MVAGFAGHTVTVAQVGHCKVYSPWSVSSQTCTLMSSSATSTSPQCWQIVRILTMAGAFVLAPTRSIGAEGHEKRVWPHARRHSSAAGSSLPINESTFRSRSK
jgi:hypothetical protein